jgi:hypothetical protein
MGCQKNREERVGNKTYSRIHGTEDQSVPMTILSSRQRRSTYNTIAKKTKVRDKFNYDNQKKKAYAKMKHPTQVPPQMKNTLTPRLAALTPFTPVVDALTR